LGGTNFVIAFGVGGGEEEGERDDVRKKKGEDAELKAESMSGRLHEKKRS